MTLTIERPLLSEAEFWRLQQTDDSVRGYELEDGRLVPMPPLNIEQSSGGGEVYFRLRVFLASNPLGRVWQDVATYLDPAGRRRYFPDIVYLANDELHRCVGEAIRGRPTMVCEVAGADSLARDRGEKMRAYREAGVAWYWLLDLVDGRMEEYRLDAGRYQLVSSTPVGELFRPALFPGLEIPLRW